jgi:predicted transcriptional regulator
MSKRLTVHPKAYLTSRRNVATGLRSRTKILFVLENGRKSAGEVAKEAALSYKCVTYHLNAMRKDRLVDRIRTTKPFSWVLTSFGQQELPMQ